jgi:tetratricopeptide (TPR) repeat protein
MPRQRTRGRGGRAPAGTNRRLESGLERVSRLIAEEQWAAADLLLDELESQFPGAPELLAHRLAVATALEDAPGFLHAAEQMARLAPDDPDTTLALASGYLLNMLPALAFRTFQTYLRRWPEHEHADEVREQIMPLEAMLRADLATIGLEGDDGIEVVALYEQVEMHVARNEWEAAIRGAQQVLKRKPDFLPALNTMSMAQFFAGRIADAIATARRVIEAAPDNHHALGNLTRFLILSGRLDEARTVAEQLKALDARLVDVAIKQAEALALLGDDEGVLAVRARVSRVKDKSAEPDSRAMLHHLAAVAAHRLGRTAEAKRLWKMALDALPELDLASDNLEDLELPPEERNAPWPFGLQEWLPDTTVKDLVKTVPRPGTSSPKAAEHGVRRFLAQHPEFEALVPLLLDRGDPPGRALAFEIALMGQTPALNAALRDFGLGMRGPDDMRFEAVRAAQRAGLLPNGDIRMWNEGEWRDVLMLDIEIYHEPVVRRIHPRAQDLHDEAGAALYANDGAKAERLLAEARTLAPDDPSILNNLAVAYQLQGKQEQAEAAAEEVSERFPDYLFGIVSRVHRAIHAGELDEAEALLRPLYQQRRLHISEFAAIAQAQLSLLLEQDDPDAARDWLDLWQEIDPERVAGTNWNLRVSMAQIAQGFSRTMRRRQRVVEGE